MDELEIPTIFSGKQKSHTNMIYFLHFWAVALEFRDVENAYFLKSTIARYEQDLILALLDEDYKE